MTRTRRLCAATVLAPALVVAAAPLASAAPASSGPAMLKASQLGSGWSGETVANGKVGDYKKLCKNTLPGKNDATRTAFLVKEISKSSTDFLVESVITTPSSSDATALFNGLKSFYKSCGNATVKSLDSIDPNLKFTFKLSPAHAPSVGADAGTAVKGTFKASGTEDGTTFNLSGSDQANLYRTGKYVVLIEANSIAENVAADGSSITVTAGYGAAVQKLAVKAGKAAIKNL